VEGAEQLLSHGANVNAANSRGETPLIFAVQRRSIPMVRLLLSQGANRNQSDSVAGYSALDYARQDRRSAAVLRILEEGATPRRNVVGPTR
jgi:ankyrin repeat protein